MPGADQELTPLGVASTNIELINKYSVVLPLAFDSYEARYGHSRRGLRGLSSGCALGELSNSPCIGFLPLPTTLPCFSSFAPRNPLPDE